MFLSLLSNLAFAATPFVITGVASGGDSTLIGTVCGSEVPLKPVPAVLPADCVNLGLVTLDVAGKGVRVRTRLTEEESRAWALHEAKAFGMIGTLGPTPGDANLFGTEGLPEAPQEGPFGLLEPGIMGLGGGTPIPAETTDRGMVQGDGARISWRFVGDFLRVTANVPAQGWVAIGVGAPNLRSFVARPNGAAPTALECRSMPPGDCGEGVPIAVRLVAGGGVWQTLELDIPTSPPQGSLVLVPGDRLIIFAKWSRGADPGADDVTGSIYEEITL